MKVKNVILSIDLIDGHEHIDNIGKILKIFTLDNNNLQFQLNNTELTINTPKIAIQSFVINYNTIKVMIAEKHLDEGIRYASEKILKIASISDSTLYSKISFKYNILFTEEDEITKNFKEKLFKVVNVKYFNLVLNEIKITEEIKTNTKIFTGMQSTAVVTAHSSGSVAVNQTFAPQQNIYVFENDVYLENTNGLSITETFSDQINLLCDNSVGKVETFLEIIRDSINL